MPPSTQHYDEDGPRMGTVSHENPLAAMGGGVAQRAFRTFTFPEDVGTEIMSSPDWHGRPPADLSFGLTTLKLSDEIEASKAQSPQLAMIMRSIVMIGGHKRLDYTYKQDWLEAIGPKGRSIVGEIFSMLNSDGQNVGKSMFSAGGGWTT